MRKFVYVSCNGNMMVQHLGVRFSAEQQSLSVLMTAALDMKMYLRPLMMRSSFLCHL